MCVFCRVNQSLHAVANRSSLLHTRGPRETVGGAEGGSGGFHDAWRAVLTYISVVESVQVATALACTPGTYLFFILGVARLLWWAPAPPCVRGVSHAKLLVVRLSERFAAAPELCYMSDLHDMNPQGNAAGSLLHQCSPG